MPETKGGIDFEKLGPLGICFKDIFGTNPVDLFTAPSSRGREWVFPTPKEKNKRDYTNPEFCPEKYKRKIYSLYLQGFSDEEITIIIGYNYPKMGFDPYQVGDVIELMNQLLT